MKKDEIVYDDFAKVEMRLGEIVEVKDFPRARNPSYKVCVEFGELGQRWSSAQIKNFAPGKYSDGGGLWLHKRPDGGGQWFLQQT